MVLRNKGLMTQSFVEMLHFQPTLVVAQQFILPLLSPPQDKVIRYALLVWSTP